MTRRTFGTKGFENLDGQRIREYWTQEANALLATYRQFETLLPNPNTSGAAHYGEDGRFVESLLRSYLKRFLPSGLELLTGFILRPAVKTGVSGRERNNDSDQHSGQLDIIVYDSMNYPVFQRFENTAVVPPEGVVAVVSVKKHLHDRDIAHEAKELLDASRLCRSLTSSHSPRRGPFLALVGMRSLIDKKNPPTTDWIFRELQTTYSTAPLPYFDDLLGYIGALDSWSIFKRRPNNTQSKAAYIWVEHKNGEEHLGFQFLLTGILSVAFDPTRSILRRPGFTAFEPHRRHDLSLGEIAVRTLRANQ